jgi:type IV secretory pathway VirB2 component (pilin)
MNPTEHSARCGPDHREFMNWREVQLLALSEIAKFVRNSHWTPNFHFENARSPTPLGLNIHQQSFYKRRQIPLKSRTSRKLPLTRILIPCWMALLFAVPVFAQAGGGGSPFDSTLNALLSFAQGTFAKIAAILAVIFGGWQVLSGDGHGKRAIGGLVVGVGLMVYAAPLITWLFP